jgi:hypothetical protein
VILVAHHVNDATVTARGCSSVGDCIGSVAGSRNKIHLNIHLNTAEHDRTSFLLSIASTFMLFANLQAEAARDAATSQGLDRRVASLLAQYAQAAAWRAVNERMGYSADAKNDEQRMEHLKQDILAHLAEQSQHIGQQQQPLQQPQQQQVVLQDPVQALQQSVLRQLDAPSAAPTMARTLVPLLPKASLVPCQLVSLLKVLC